MTASKKRAPRVALLCWDDADAAALRDTLAVDFAIFRAPSDGGAAVRALRDDPPAAVVIDLRRRPAHGRDVALALRSTKATRRTPLIFVAADPEKTAAIQQVLPHAEFTDPPAVAAATARAIANPPPDSPPPSRFAGYSETPLLKKLTIKDGTAVRLVGAPAEFEKTLGELPPGAVVRRRGGDRPDLLIWFAKSVAELRRDIGERAALDEPTRLWIAWPKKGAAPAGDLSEKIVREVGLAAGLVDYKICAIDAAWSGLLFKRRAMK
jgi:CheY-like chemotaxis protein